MILGGLFLAAALTADAPERAAAVRFEPEAAVAAGDVRLGQLADLSALPSSLRDRAAGLVIARLSAERPAVALTARSLSARARALMPALSPWLPDGAAGTVALRVQPAKPAQAAGAPRLPAVAAAAVTPGQKLFVHARIGAVEVTREVTALQSGRPGHALFVRASDGAVFSVKLEELSS